jgi:hypothetical protein
VHLVDPDDGPGGAVTTSRSRASNWNALRRPCRPGPGRLSKLIADSRSVTVASRHPMWAMSAGLLFRTVLVERVEVDIAVDASLLDTPAINTA